MTARIALLGDHNPDYKAHQAIPRALTLAGAGEWHWIHTTTLGDDPAAQLAPYAGLWCVPGSPYANGRGVIAAIRVARTSGLPFLGTCGGFQHALLEYAEAAWGIEHAVHAELDPDAQGAVITPLACQLVEVGGDVIFEPGSRVAAMYAAPRAFETYHCSYGLNPQYAARLASGPLRCAARDASGDVRAMELEGHPFFFSTLFQPERSAFTGAAHPLIEAFVRAAKDHALRLSAAFRADATGASARTVRA